MNGQVFRRVAVSPLSWSPSCGLCGWSHSGGCPELWLQCRGRRSGGPGTWLAVICAGRCRSASYSGVPSAWGLQEQASAPSQAPPQPSCGLLGTQCLFDSLPRFPFLQQPRHCRLEPSSLGSVWQERCTLPPAQVLSPVGPGLRVTSRSALPWLWVEQPHRRSRPALVFSVLVRRSVMLRGAGRRASCLPSVCATSAVPSVALVRDWTGGGQRCCLSFDTGRCGQGGGLLKHCTRGAALSAAPGPPETGLSPEPAACRC